MKVADKGAPVSPSVVGGPPKRILLIGWRITTLQALHELGAEVWCITRPDIFARFGANVEVDRVVLVSDTTDVEEMVCALSRAGRALSDFDAICSQQEFSVVAAAVLGGESSPVSTPTAVLLRDKFLQKTRIAEEGLPVARCWILPDIDALAGARSECPVAIKPILGAACANTLIVRDEAAFDDALATLRTSGFSGPFLLEEFITGVEHHVDGVIRDGELAFLAITRYLQNVIELDAGVVSGVALDPSRYTHLYEKVRSLADAALRALGHRDGVFHLEVFVDGEKVTFSECAGRVGGGCVDRMLRAHFGVDMHREWAKPMVGLRTPVDAALSEDVHGYAFLMSPAAGVVRSIPSREEFFALDDVVFGRPRVGVGYEVVAPNAASDVHLGEVVVRGATEDAVVKRLHELKEWFRARVVLD